MISNQAPEFRPFTFTLVMALYRLVASLEPGLAARACPTSQEQAARALEQPQPWALGISLERG